MSELYRSENVVVRCVPTADQSRWVITFDNYSIGHGFDRPGFGEAWLESQGISAIHVLGKREDWYQYPEMAEAMAAVRRAVAGADRVMTYGSSMGAYAAIRFADAAGANAVLALSPQYSIDPAKRPYDTRWCQDAHRIQWLESIDGVIRCQCSPVVVYDTIGIDAAHAERIAEDIAITRVGLPYTAHPTTTYLGETGLLQALVLDVLAGTFDEKAFASEAWKRRKTSVVYRGELINCQRQRQRPRLALALARASAAQSEGNAYAMTTLAKQLSLAGEYREALAVHRKILEIGGRAATYLISYGQDLVSVGEVSEARDVAHEILALMPHLAHLHGWAAGVFWVAGYPEEALNAARTAAAMDVPNRHYRELIVKFRYGDRAAAIWRLSSKLRRRVTGMLSGRALAR